MSSGTFGECLRRLRRRSDLTQAQLAEQTGVSRKRIVEMETGRFTNVSLGVIARLATEESIPGGGR